MKKMARLAALATSVVWSGKHVAQAKMVGRRCILNLNVFAFGNYEPDTVKEQSNSK